MSASYIFVAGDHVHCVVWNVEPIVTVQLSELVRV